MRGGGYEQKEVCVCIKIIREWSFPGVGWWLDQKEMWSLPPPNEDHTVVIAFLETRLCSMRGIVIPEGCGTDRASSKRFGPSDVSAAKRLRRTECQTFARFSSCCANVVCFHVKEDNFLWTNE